MASKETLFARGVKATEVVFGVADTYVCPICGEGFKKEALSKGILTAEHVPPSSQGGKRIILTCKTCNHVAGYTIDSQASLRTRQQIAERIVMQGETGYAGRFKVILGGQQLNVDVSTDDVGTGVIKILGRHTNPAHTGAAQSFMEALAQEGKTDGYTMRLTSSERFNRRLAYISDLRVAFLAAVAKFGYRYAGHHSLDVVRAQILRPEISVLDNWWSHDSRQTNQPTLSVHLADGMISAAWTNTRVFLPWPNKPIETYLERIKELHEKRSITLETDGSYPWPTSFEAILDRGPT